MGGRTLSVNERVVMKEAVNQNLMAIFLSMAGLLASRGENSYKVKAYRRAADSLNNLHEDVARVTCFGIFRE